MGDPVVVSTRAENSIPICFGFRASSFEFSYL